MQARSRPIHIWAIISLLGGILTLWGYFLPVVTYNNFVKFSPTSPNILPLPHQPDIVVGDANFLLPFIAMAVIGISAALVVVQIPWRWLLLLCLGAALLGLVTHFFICARVLIIPYPLPANEGGMLNFDAGAGLPFLGLFLSIGGILIGLISRKPKKNEQIRSMQHAT